MEQITFQKLKKYAKKADTALASRKIAILGDNATQFLKVAIKGEGVRKGLNFELYEADYNQIEAEIINPSSGLYDFQPEFILLFYSTEGLQKSYQKYGLDKKANFADNHINLLKDYLEILSDRLKTKVILVNHPVLTDNIYGNFGLKVESGFRFQLSRINYKIQELGLEWGNLFVADLLGLQSQIGYTQRIDQRFYYQASMVLSIEMLPLFARSIVQMIEAISGVGLKKCLILDLDHTVWGGVIGDDGLEKILVGNIDGGKPFTELQQWAKALKNRGIILCVCSKNNEDVAKTPFEKHPEMVLRLSDISVFVANWENKADNIRYIQSVLNIGFDSMVFIDDNPFERNLVRTELPSVTVPELPKDPSEYMAYLNTLGLFETASVSKEDASRTKKYQEEAKRVAAKVKYKSIDGYLESMEMQADIQPFNSFSIPRIAQLTQRSNQFNLRTVRYTENEIDGIIKSEDYITLQLRLLDKFGDYGIVSLIIGKIEEGNRLFIDSWIMSCRVLKRGVEQFVLDQIVLHARERKIEKIIGEHLPTPKNKLVENHYQNLGFVESAGLWELDINTYQPKGKYIALFNNQVDLVK